MGELKHGGGIASQFPSLDWGAGEIAIEVHRRAGNILTKNGSSAQISICGFLRKAYTEDAGNMEYRDGIPAAWYSGRRHRVEASSYSGEIGATFYGCDTAHF